MKRILLLSLAVMAIAVAHAAPIDPATAADIVRNRAARTVAYGQMAPARVDVKLIHSEFGSSGTTQPLFYIFNTADGYYIISGDDRARDVLARGDAPLDINNMPANMRFWLDSYREQMDYLMTHPEITVSKARRAPARAFESIEPLLTSAWSQGAPYYDECPEVDGSRCVTGCAATALAMVFHYWKYPTDETSKVAAYSTVTHSLSLPELEPTTFDWDNMLDYYGRNYSKEQGAAVAHLMRYIGQAEKMDYSPDGSGTGPQDILRAVKLFNYDQSASLKSKTNWWGETIYDDYQWGDLLLEELESERPIVMCAYMQDAGGLSGHAFDIDGYDADDDTYHVNWGWGGSGNAFFALNAFGYSGMMFNIMQQVIVGIEPKITEPTIKTNRSIIEMQAYEDSTQTYSLTVRGVLLTDDIVLELDDQAGVFSITQERISANINRNNRITVSYSPERVGTHYATITISSAGAEDKIVELQGICKIETRPPYDFQVVKGDDERFDITWQDKTPRRNLDNYELAIAPLPFSELRMSEPFDGNVIDGVSSTDYASKLDGVTQQPGWTGSKVYRSGTDLILGTSKAKGWIETPELDMCYNQGLVTIKIEAKAAGTTPSVPLTISCGSADTTITVFNCDSAYCVMLPCPPGEHAKVRFASSVGRRVMLSKVDIYAGENYSPVNEDLVTTIKGITTTSWQLADLHPGYFALRLRSIFTTGEVSEWTPWTPIIVNWMTGDVNHDSEINLADVNQVVDVIVAEQITPSMLSFNDVNGDGKVNIADLNVIIDRILSEK